MWIRKRYGLDPVREVPIYIGGKQYGEAKVHTPEPPRSPYNCPNCCAPVVKEYCEYCGTRFGLTVFKVDGFKERDEIERLKAEFNRFHEIAHNLGSDHIEEGDLWQAEHK